MNARPFALIVPPDSGPTRQRNRTTLPGVKSLLLIVYARLCGQKVSCCGPETSSELRKLDLLKDLQTLLSFGKVIWFSAGLSL